jgi:hypothetical protein
MLVQKLPQSLSREAPLERLFQLRLPAERGGNLIFVETWLAASPAAE